MKTLTLNDDATAKRLYKTVSSEMKEILENTYGKEFFFEKIIDRVKTLEDALAIVGASDNVKTLLSYNGIDKDMLAAVALAKLTIIAKALNEGWKPNWNDSNQWKYYAWFKMSGFGLSYDGYDYSHSSTSVGSRLVFKNSELATYAGNQFLSLYNDLLTI